VSAITGIFHPDGRPVERATIERMVATLTHRGPDGSGAWSAGPVGLGHQMLWTTPESLHERLPFTTDRGDLTITADARIDNSDELIAVLRIRDRQITDSQVILAAYERWGEDCPKHLIGDFAFAIWDARRQALFCARDHFGVKPFYYHHRSGRLFAFGTEMKAFLCRMPWVNGVIKEIRCLIPHQLAL
jgi:asparagine synthase (glutamine-hydrolysing)